MPSLPRHHGWTVERLVPLLGGAMVLFSVVLTLALSSWWLILTGFVAANLLLYATVGWCPASLLMQRLGLRRLADPA